MLGVIEFASFILIGLPAGVWVDLASGAAYHRRPRAPALLASCHRLRLRCADDLRALPRRLLFGVLTVFFDVAYQSYLPRSCHVTSSSTATRSSRLALGRPARRPCLAGGLVQALTAPVAMLVDAISFVASGLFVLAHSQARGRLRAGGGRAPSAGMRPSCRKAALRPRPPLPTLDRGLNGDLQLLRQRDVVDLPRLRGAQLGLGAGTIGVVFAIGNVGYLVARSPPTAIAGKLGVGPAIVVGAATGIAALLIPLAPESWPIPFLIAAGSHHELRSRASTTSRRAASARRSRPSGSRAG